LLLSNVLWWITGIVLGMGFWAARKADVLRASRIVR
jgi:hypothetical protein